jgi:dihydroxy-acid dehydratase
MRSEAWLSQDDEVALNHRAALRTAGFRRSRARRPLIGIACTASDLNRCDRGLSVLAAAVRRGVAAAGGLPLEFGAMSLSEDLMKPTAMLYRNLLAIEVEETIRSQPLDGIVALGNCDKTVPAYLMALASADIPALIVTGGFRVPSWFNGERLGSGTALWRLYDARRAGLLGSAEWARLETCLGQGLGACNTMGGLGAGAGRVRARRDGHAGVGQHPDPGQAAQPGRYRHAADHRRADERNRVWDRSAARGAGERGWRAAVPAAGRRYGFVGRACGVTVGLGRSGLP